MIRPQAQDDGPDRPGDGRFGLRILATTDLHMHLSAHNYFTDRPAPGTGLVHLASLVRAARAEARARGDAVLLLDNGDSLQGTPMEDLPLHPPPPGPDGEPAHPMMLAMAELGYDAIGLGNHDFDFGLARLAVDRHTFITLSGWWNRWSMPRDGWCGVCCCSYVPWQFL